MKYVAGHRRHIEPEDTDESGDVDLEMLAIARANYRGARRVRGIFWTVIAIAAGVVLLGIIIAAALVLAS